MPKKFTKEEVANYLKDNGYELLSKYKNMHDKLRVVDGNGNEHYDTLMNIKARVNRGGNRRINKYSQEDVKEILKKYGYHTDSVYKNSREKLNLICKKGHLSRMSLSNFYYNGSRCSMCRTGVAGGMSIGEGMVWNVLKHNKQLFSYLDREVTIKINDNSHRVDFLFVYEGKTYAVEYDGKQHYYEQTGYFFDTLNERKERDLEKDKYFLYHGETMIRIPYTIETVDEVASLLSLEIGACLNIPSELDGLETVKEVADYYLTHDIKETKNVFNISTPSVRKYFILVYGKNKKEYVTEMAVKYYLNHSQEDTLKIFDLSAPTLRKKFKELYGVTKTEYEKGLA